MEVYSIHRLSIVPPPQLGWTLELEFKSLQKPEIRNAAKASRMHVVQCTVCKHSEIGHIISC